MTEAEFAEMRLVADQWACQKLQEKYWYGEAKRDVDMICSVFSENARYGKANGMAQIRKQVETYMSMMGPILDNYYIVPISVNIEVDGDKASGEIRGVAFNKIRKRDGSTKMLIVGAGYTDEFVRTPDGWRISAMGGIEDGPDVPHDTTWVVETDISAGGLAAVFGP
jgi:hypothetical protein